MTPAMFVTKAMRVVMKLAAIWVATRKRHVCADILKPVSFKLRFGKIMLENFDLGFLLLLLGEILTKQFEPLRY